jgi:NAD(P)-dependent dehydrogenase (short-subunit alcohol dehydrogenase family)
VVNSAGITTFGPLLQDDKQDVEHVFGIVTFDPLNAAKAFAPVLAANGGGALVNLYSPTEWIAGFPGTGTYGAKNDPCVVAADIVAALEDGGSELMADDASRYFEAALADAVRALSVAS